MCRNFKNVLFFKIIIRDFLGICKQNFHSKCTVCIPQQLHKENNITVTVRKNNGSNLNRFFCYDLTFWSFVACIGHKSHCFNNVNYTDIFCSPSWASSPSEPAGCRGDAKPSPLQATAAFNRRRFRALQILAALAFMCQKLVGVEV